MKPGIFWVASFPKSGNTWLRMIIASLQAGGSDVDINQSGGEEDLISSNRRVFDTLLDIDSSLLTPDEIRAAQPHAHRLHARLLRATAFRKTHEACIQVGDGQPLFPADATEGVVYIVRDPRDVAISLAHHLKCTIDQAIEHMATSDFSFSSKPGRLNIQLHQLVGDWSRHVTSWLDQGPCTPFVLRYEDMLADPADAIRRFTAAAGLPTTEQAIAGAVRATRFDTLQQQEQTKGFSERPDKMARFFRVGGAGQWRRELTAGQVRRIEQRHGDVLARLGYL